MQNYNGQTLYWQFGNTPGAYSSLILKVPSKHLTLILLANSDGLSAPFCAAGWRRHVLSLRQDLPPPICWLRRATARLIWRHRNSAFYDRRALVVLCRHRRSRKPIS